jgi:hypothetical protein
VSYSLFTHALADLVRLPVISGMRDSNCRATPVTVTKSPFAGLNLHGRL